MIATPPDSVPYFYGDIPRENAELILWDRGCIDGMYLLRSSQNRDAVFVLSLCHNQTVLHYRIKRSHDGMYYVHGLSSEKFVGPVEIVQGVRHLACHPTIPCNKTLDTFMPGVSCGITEQQIQEAIRKKALEWGIRESDLETLPKDKASDLHSLVVKTLHTMQPWFHGKVSREEAEQRLVALGHKDGKFLVRERDNSSFTLLLSFQGRIKHYKIDVLPTGQVGIQDGQRFDSLLLLICHYSVFSDGLWCSLQEPCQRPELDHRPTPDPIKENSIISDANVPMNTPQQSPQPAFPLNRPIFAPWSSLHSHFCQTNGPFLTTLQSPGALNAQSSPNSKPSIANAAPEAAKPPPPPRLKANTPTAAHVSERKNASSDAAKRLPMISSPMLESTTNHRLSSSPTEVSSEVLPLPFDHNHNHCEQSKHSLEVSNNAPTTSDVPSTLTLDGNSDSASVEAQKPRPVPAPRRILPVIKQGNSRRKVSLEDHFPKTTEQDSSTEAGDSPSPTRSSTSDQHETPVHSESRIGKALKNLSLDNVLHGLRSRPSPAGTVDGNLGSPTMPTNGVPGNPQPPVVPKRKPTPPIGVPVLGSPVNSPSMSFVITELKSHLTNSGTVNRLYKSSDMGPLQSPPPSPPISLPSKVDVSSMKKSEDMVSDNGVRQAVLLHHTDDLAPVLVLPSLPVLPPLHHESTNLPALRPKASFSVPANVPEPVYEEIDPEYEKESEESPADESTSKTTSEDHSCHVHDAIDVSASCDSVVSEAVQESQWDDASEDVTLTAASKLQRKPTLSIEESERHYKTLKKHRKTPTTIDRNMITLQEVLGSGHFGDVVKAVFKSSNVEVPFAVKMLKNANASGKMEVMREARIMMGLDHPHIVRLIGICEGEPFLLVLELAPLGPLNLYLRRHPTLPQKDVLLLMHQVALGMEYLERKQFVHRDLAARNVLLVNESFAKISDFGMSRTLGLHSDYYRVEPQGKLPLKWYAPECIYYFRFSTKSDVWSFGITLWEALSYGDKPYQGMVGRDILAMFSNGERLECPPGCPKAIYDIMWKCWQLCPEDRPTFAQLASELKSLL